MSVQAAARNTDLPTPRVVDSAGQPACRGGLSLAVAAMLLAPVPAPHASADTPSWSDLSPTVGPPGRLGHVAVVDAARHRMLLIFGNKLGLANDVWSFTLAPPHVWQELQPAGSIPDPRWDHVAIMDPRRDRVLVFAGQCATDLNDVWALSRSGEPAWSLITPGGTAPAPRMSHTAILDAARNDVWALSLGGASAWTQIFATGAPPVPRRDHVAIYGPIRQRMLVHGGYAGEGFRNDVWALSLTGEPAWVELEPQGVLPEGAITHAGIYDPGRDQLVIFGGSYHNETWALPLNGPLEWLPIMPEGPLPPGRIDHSAVFDAARDRMVIFSGHGGTHGLDDTWALSFAAVAAVPFPPADDSGWQATAFPNATGGEVQLAFDLPGDGVVSLWVWDPAGRQVAETRARAVAGRNRLRWKGGAPAGRLAVGIYLYELRAEDSSGSERRATGRFAIVR